MKKINRKSHPSSLHVLVLKDKPAESKTELKPLNASFCSGIEIVPSTKFLPTNSEYDFLLITSKNSLRFVKNFSRIRVKRIVAIGRETASVISQKKAPLTIVPDPHSKGLLKYLQRKRAYLGRRVLFARSARGDTNTVKEMRKMGYQVRVIHTYRSKVLKIGSRLKKFAQQKGEFDAVFLTSPSHWSALKVAYSLRTLRSWNCYWVAIGPTTDRVLKNAGLRRRLMSEEPSLSGMKKVLLSRIRSVAKR